MKKLATICVALVLLGGLAGCGGGETPTEHAVHEQGWSGHEAKELSHTLEKVEEKQ